MYLPFALKSLSLPMWRKVKGIMKLYSQWHGIPSIAVANIKFRPAFKWGTMGISLLLPMELVRNYYLSQTAIAYPFYQAYQTAFIKCYVPRKDYLTSAVTTSLRWTLISEVELALLESWRETREQQLTFKYALLLQSCLKCSLDLANLHRGYQDYVLDSPFSCSLDHTVTQQNEKGNNVH